MIGETDNRRADMSAVSLWSRSALSLALPLLLAMTACGALNTPDTPANQRYWHDIENAVVLHWDASAHARSYTIYYNNCSEESPCTTLGKTRDTAAAIYIGEHLYRDDCSPENPCLMSSHHSGSRTTNAVDFDHNFYVVACNLFGCTEIETADPAQLLPSPDSSAPSTPTIKGNKKVIREAPDSASVTWDDVGGATYYEVWIGSDPSSEFRFDQEILSYGLMHELDIPLYSSSHSNRGSWGEYATTSWKVRACNKAGCSPFSDIITIN